MSERLNDLDAFYYEDGKNLKPLQVSFRDVLVYQKEHENDEEVRTKKDRDCEYWKKRLQNFPDAPELPILPNRNVKKLLLHNTDISLRRKIGANYVKRRECRGLLPRE